MGILACFLLILIPYATSISFNLPNITSDHNNMFILEGGAYISDDGIQVIPENNISRVTGRVIYKEQLHLWDRSSRRLASFSSNFSFVKLFDRSELYRHDDGFRFFLAQNSAVTHGEIDTTAQFVWVEFDPSCNPWENRENSSQCDQVEFDPYCNPWENSSQCDHVGINVNSITSIKYQPWLNDNSNRKECQARIKYDSVSKNLSVSFTGLQNNTVIQQDGLVLTVDLRDVLPERVVFGFAAASGELFDKNTVKSWMFNSSSLQVVENNKIGLIVGLIVGISLLITLFVMLALILRKKKKNNGDRVEELGFSVFMKSEFEIGPTGPRKFSYRELARATAGFTEKEKLGEGSFGVVYKGYLKDLSTYVAVKRVSKTSKQGIKEYASEVRIISRLRHRNLVQLNGWCHENGELLLVYEYMENGSLDAHLFKGKSLLTWERRYQIAIGLASALLYLHEEWEQCVLHRDIKSSNVMLDSNFNAKLGDFGLAKFVDHEKGSQTTILAGTLGYMAPECVTTGKTSKESDVFSFGVVALEIVCGRKSIHYKGQEEQIWLPEWVWELYGAGTFLEALDPCIGLKSNEDQVTRLMIVGLWCVHPDSKLRPSMRQVIQVLNFEASLPILPTNMPVASYFTTRRPSLFGGSNVDLSTSSSYLYGR